MGLRTFNNKDNLSLNSKEYKNKKDLGSNAGQILLGLLDVIRCGIRKYRVLRILKSAKEGLCSELGIDMTYVYVPSKLRKIKSHIADASDGTNEKTSSVDNGATVQKIAGDNKTTDASEKIENEEEKVKEVEKEVEPIEERVKEETDVWTGKIGKGKSIVFAQPLVDLSASDVKEENDEKEKENKNSEMSVEEITTTPNPTDSTTATVIISLSRTKEEIAVEKMFAEKAEVVVTLPDSYLLVGATSRYGFDVKSVLCNSFPNPLKTQLEHHFVTVTDGEAEGVKEAKVGKEREKEKEKEVEKVREAAGDSEDNLICTNSSSSSSDSALQSDSLFHPMSVRLDRTQQLVRSLNDVILGSYIR